MARLDLWDFYGQYDEQRANLTRAQVVVLAICDLRQEINSGGFDVYFRYLGGDSAPEALVGIGGALGSSWEDLLREAVALFGDVYPVDTNERQKKLDELALDDQLDMLNRRFFELEASTEADDRLAAWLDQPG